MRGTRSLKYSWREMSRRISSAIPKSELVVLSTYPDLDDQGLAIIDAITPSLRVKWIVTNVAQARRRAVVLGLPKNIQLVSRNSFGAYWCYVRASHVFMTHGLYGNGDPVGGQKIINLWHGMPTKNIGVDLGSTQAQPVASSAAIATSKMFQEIMARVLGLSPERVWITGLPRNDRLMRSALAGKGTGPVMWLPTFRDHLQKSTDGIGESPVFLQGVDAARLDSEFAGLGLRCVVKLHPLDHRPLSAHLNSVEILSDVQIASAHETLYEHLGGAPALITDYSSVWIDYLLLDRPIIFFVPDSQDYESSRGLNESASFMEKVGPKVTTLEGVVSWLRRFLIDGDDPYVAGRKAARDAMHAWVDDRSARRVLERSGLAQADLPQRGE